MAKLPYSRVVNVTLTRSDAFPSRRGFGVLLILTHTAVAGKLDATNRTKVYGSMEEVAVDHIASTDFYKAAEAAFMQNPRPTQVKGGFITFTPAGGSPDNAATLKTQLDALYAADADWYWLTTVASMRDIAALDGLFEWVQGKNKQAGVDSNDVALENPADTSNVAARNKGEFDRSSVFYHTDPAEYLAAAAMAKAGTFGFDDANSNYTLKFKNLAGVPAINKGSAAVQAITGFTPGLGQSTSAGHMANTYVDVGGRSFLVEGSTLTPNVFIDEIHATDYLIARTEEETLGVMLNNKAIEYTDAGMEVLASGVRTVMAQAARAGLIANDIDENGDYAPAVEITVPSIFSVPASQRKARIAPAIAVKFRYAGAIHYTTINYTMSF